MQNAISKVIEEYLQAIYLLKAENGSVKSIQIAQQLGVSPSTVHAALMRMQRDRLITINQKKEIEFTPEGSQKANHLTRRLQLVETLLREKLKLPKDEIHQHADVLEHYLTPLIEEKLAVYLRFHQD